MEGKTKKTDTISKPSSRKGDYDGFFWQYWSLNAEPTPLLGRYILALEPQFQPFVL
jgi:hypothetical protein